MPSTTLPSQNVPAHALNVNPKVGATTDKTTKETPKLFTPYTSKSVTFHNRIVV